MNLSQLQLRPEYTKGDDDIAADFYLPCLSAASRYDRITGYFSSSVYVVAWPAMRDFVARSGRIRIVCSPLMSPTDIAGLEQATDADGDERLTASLLAQLEAMLGDPVLRCASLGLACLVTAGTVEIRIAQMDNAATPVAKRLFHDKVGVFSDDLGHSVGFRGSMNETFLGLAADGNLESIDVFPSWHDGRDAQRATNALTRFETLWNGQTPGVRVSNLPEKVRSLLVEASATSDWPSLIDELSAHTATKSSHHGRRRIGDRTLLSHQDQILSSWQAANMRGIAEAATGAGKTTIGIAAAHLAADHALGVLILVPTTLLLDQWVDELRKLLPTARVLRFGDGDRSWSQPGVLRRLASPTAGEERIAVATMQTASQSEFLRLLGQAQQMLVIADEVHRLGSPAFSRVMELAPRARLGLSATPKRYGDPPGTARLLDWFGAILTPSYSLSDALAQGVLTPYAYHPHHVELTPEEHERWTELSIRIGRRAAALNGDTEGDPSLKVLLIRRSRISKTAARKTVLAADILKAELRLGQRWLVYCDSQSQVSSVRSSLQEAGISSLDYHSQMAGNRGATLDDFEVNGGVVVAIRCLDEGVDLPAVTHALILASSRNPREFIQRRGRVLRRYPGKTMAHVHDMLVTPPVDQRTTDRLLMAELGRALEFARNASNPDSVVDLEALCARCGVDPAAIRDIGDESEDEDSNGD